MTPKLVRVAQLKYHWPIYFFVLPSLLFIGLFAYYPAAAGAYHSTFRWNGADINEYTGLENFTTLIKKPDFWKSFRVALIIGVWNIAKMIPAIAAAVCINRVISTRMQFLYRVMFVAPMVVPGLILALIWRTFFFDATMGYLNRSLVYTGLYKSLVLFCNFTGLTDAFAIDHYPAWLGDGRLILFSCIIWGFPWVASFAVLTHLAKLQGIPKELVEASELDGANWWTKFTRLELPMISGSINILIVLVLIDTFKDATLIYALAGLGGGPGGNVDVPALFMLREAFMNQSMGSACAVGIVLVIIVLAMKALLDRVVDWRDLGAWQKLGMRLIGVVLAWVFYEYLSSPFLAVVTGGAVFPWMRLADCWQSARAPRALEVQTEARQGSLLTGAIFAVSLAAIGPLLGAAFWWFPSYYGFGLLGALVILPWQEISWMVRGSLNREESLVLADPWAPTPHQVKVRAAHQAWIESASYAVRERTKAVALRIGKHLFVWLLLAFAYLPLMLMLIVSVKTNAQYNKQPAMLTTPMHLENWTNAWTAVTPSLANSVFVTVTSTAVTLLMALGAAYFFARVRVPGSKFLWNAILILMMMPTIANMAPLFILLKHMDLLNTLTCIIAVGAAGGQVFAIFVLRNFVADLPQDLFEAAEIDGAGHLRQMFTIVAPLSGPILGVVGLMHAIGQWNDFVFPLIVLSDEDKLTVMVQLTRMNGEYVKHFGPLMAGYAMASIPVIFLFIACMRLFTRGLTEGAVKG